MEGKKVLLVDCGPQGSLSISLGNPQPDQLPVTLATMMGKVLNEEPIDPGEGILDYLQSLYEKKLCTYPRTDSRLLKNDMEASVPALASVAAAICSADAPESLNAGQVCDSAKASDHHAVVPTPGAGNADVSALPAGEREILRLVSRQLLCAVSGPHQFAETAATLACGGYSFTIKGKTVPIPGWKRRYAALTRREKKESDVIAYHLRQSFRPGEIDPAKAYG